jgi:hypothetical protein
MYVLKEEHLKVIEEISKQVSCDKHVQCYTSGLTNLYKAEAIGSDAHPKCFDKRPQSCQYSYPKGDSHYCRCPLRAYISKNLNL